MDALPMGVGTPRRDASPMASDLEVPMVLRNLAGHMGEPVEGDRCDASARGGPCRRFVGDVAIAEAKKDSSPLGVL